MSMNSQPCNLDPVLTLRYDFKPCQKTMTLRSKRCHGDISRFAHQAIASGCLANTVYVFDACCCKTKVLFRANAYSRFCSCRCMTRSRTSHASTARLTCLALESRRLQAANLTQRSSSSLTFNSLTAAVNLQRIGSCCTEHSQANAMVCILLCGKLGFADHRLTGKTLTSGQTLISLQESVLAVFVRYHRPSSSGQTPAGIRSDHQTVQREFE